VLLLLLLLLLLPSVMLNALLTVRPLCRWGL
jgi:hypothetical protein